MGKLLNKIEKNIFLSLSIRCIVDGIKDGSISPFEIAQQCIERIEELNHRYKVWVCFDKETLFCHAREISIRLMEGKEIRPLESIPIGIKDIFNTLDFPTQMGSELWKNFTSGNDSRIVYYLKQAGAVIPGKTDTAEFAVHAIGNCLNPHNPLHTPGTSSSGSAVAVALGMVPASIGTQTAGSIVRPASFCGVYGCKPSFGLIPRTGMLKTTDSLDSIGYFTSMYEDLIRIFDTLRVHGSNYPISNNALNDDVRQNKPKNLPWRIAFIKTNTWDHAPEYAKNSIIEFINNLSSIEDIHVSQVIIEKLNSAHEVHQTIYDKTLSYYFQEEFKKPEYVSKIMNEIIQRGNKISVREYHEALKEQELMIHIAEDFFDDYDILISLSTSGDAPLRQETERPDPSLIWTLCHLPVISSPVFISPNKLPYGVQFVARKYNDILLFRFTNYLRERGLIPEGVNPFLSL